MAFHKTAPVFQLCIHHKCTELKMTNTSMCQIKFSKIDRYIKKNY